MHFHVSFSIIIMDLLVLWRPFMVQYQQRALSENFNFRKATGLNVLVFCDLMFALSSLLCGFQADLNYNVQDDPAAFYGVTSQYESSENMTITCSTKVCSFGKQVVEKVEVRTEDNC